jgi:hypothetical protein
MGWQVREPYVNGGVIWYGGTDGSFSFADAWHQNWLTNVVRTERYRDQPALNHSLSADQAISLEILPYSFNAQVGMRSDLAEEALIWHIYSSTGLGSQDQFSWCCQRLMKERSGHLSARAISKLAMASSLQRPPSIVTFLRSKVRSKLKGILKHGW